MSSIKLSYPADPQSQNDEPERPEPPEPDAQESSMQELKSLAKSIAAEAGMARLSATRWADLRRCALVDHAPGQWRISSPDRPESQPQIVTLTWLAGAMLLAESYSPDAPTLSLPLPPVRDGWQWKVPPATGLPVPPPQKQWESPEETGARDRAEEARRAAWQRHLAPLLAEAGQMIEADQTQAQDNEQTLAVAAMRAIQRRRLDPEGAEQTLAQELETIAAPMRE